MSRTRIIFFAVLALYLALVAAGLAAQLLDSRLLQQMFIAATVFSIGVVLLDFLGVLGGHHGDATPGDAGHNFGDLSGHAMGNHATGIDHGGAAGHAAGDHSGQAEAGHATHAHDTAQSAAGPIISALAYLRLLVYFCLGFGPAGWVALASGRSALVSLAIAAPFGFGALLLAQAFFRFQRHDTDSQLASEELVAREATVIVPLNDRTMGKVRVTAGLNVVDLYALAADPGRDFDKGAHVRIARVTDECVYVR